jgi:hypothetical protein
VAAAQHPGHESDSPAHVSRTSPHRHSNDAGVGRRAAILRDRMWFSRDVLSIARLRAGVVLAIVGVATAGGGCTLLLETDADPYRCGNDQDCARFPDAACDSVKKQCVPRLPAIGWDAGPPADTGGGLACELSFDNSIRIPLSGPDGGLRPLPDAAP